MRAGRRPQILTGRDLVSGEWSYRTTRHSRVGGEAGSGSVGGGAMSKGVAEALNRLGGQAAFSTTRLASTTDGLLGEPPAARCRAARPCRLGKPADRRPGRSTAQNPNGPGQPPRAPPFVEPQRSVSSASSRTFSAGHRVRRTPVQGQTGHPRPRLVAGGRPAPAGQSLHKTAWTNAQVARPRSLVDLSNGNLVESCVEREAPRRGGSEARPGDELVRTAVRPR